MAVFKCKMCGGELDIQEGQVIATCDYCGTKQTVPTACSEELRTLYNRANVLRMKSEFDKAEQVYERIITADPKQAEAYWGALLCKYGIEYVEDPKTYKRIPTCHRVSYEAMEADEYYKLAIENADSVQRKIYEEEAKYIDGVQKDILALSAKEDSFDVFLCYKETDESGKRTRDSVIANDIYHQLTQEGYNVFYAAITLEDKLGSAYEPVIFAALNSAKVMLVIGTKPEYFNAVWVKNEWSRFLKLMKTDHSKLLIPCYQDMDAYELPEEFAHLQAQDMAKIGFISDIVRGIKKVIVKEGTDHPARAAEKAEQSAGSSAAPLLKRAYMFAQDEDWENARQYAERVLDIDPENAEAYLVKLLCDLKLPNIEALSASEVSFVENSNYKRAQMLADEKTNALLKDSIYSIAKRKIGQDNIPALREGRKIFEQILGWKDVDEIMAGCDRRISVLSTQSRAQTEDFRKKYGVISNMISVDYDCCVVGLKSDGTVVAASGNQVLNSFYERMDISTKEKIIQVVAYNHTIIGLKNDGTIVVSPNSFPNNSYVPYLNNIVKVLRDINLTGLEANGTVVEWSSHSYLSEDVVKVLQRNIKDIFSDSTGITLEGKLVIFKDVDSALAAKIAQWKDIVYFCKFVRHELFDNVRTKVDIYIGVRTDGTLVAIDTLGRTEKDYEFGGWENIVTIRAGGHYLLVGLKSDGTLMVERWEDTDAKETDADIQYRVNLEMKHKAETIITWKDIVAIDNRYDNFVGVKKDGTVVVDDYKLQGLIKDWKLFDNADYIYEEIAECQHKVEETRKRLLAEKKSLDLELSTLGIFAFKRKREIQTRLWQIDVELGKL